MHKESSIHLYQTVKNMCKQTQIQLILSRTTLTIHNHIKLDSFFTRKLRNIACKANLSHNSNLTTSKHICSSSNGLFYLNRLYALILTLDPSNTTMYRYIYLQGASLCYHLRHAKAKFPGMASKA